MLLTRIKRAYHAFVEPEGLKFTGVLTPQDQAADVQYDTYSGNLIQGSDAWGDGKAEFLGEGTPEEFIDQQRADKGMLGWYDKFKEVIKKV